MSEQIIQIIISVFPSALAILTTVGVVFKVIGQFAALKSQVVDMKEMTEVKTELKALARENRELKKKLNETLTKIDHIRRD